MIIIVLYFLENFTMLFGSKFEPKFRLKFKPEFIDVTRILYKIMYDADHEFIVKKFFIIRKNYQQIFSHNVKKRKKTK